MNELNPIPDFIVGWAKSTTKRIRECSEESGGICPLLLYMRNNAEFSIPLDYEHLVNMGLDMSQGHGLIRALNVSRVMGMTGPEFGMFAMQLAERARAEPNQVLDECKFFDSVEHMLCHLGPQALTVAMPTLIVTGKIDPKSLAEVEAAGPDHPNASKALIVCSRNQVRTFTQITPFDEKNGHFTWKKPYTIDSLRGQTSRGLTPFSDFYAPAIN